MRKASENVAVQPVDRQGNVLEPLDLVILGEIPEHYYGDLDPKSAHVLKGYAGKYGLITYFMHEPYYNGNKSHPGWVSGDASAVYVLSRAINDDHVSSYDFWAPSKYLTEDSIQRADNEYLCRFPLGDDRRRRP